MDKRNVELTVSNRTVFRVLALLLGAFLVVKFFSNLQHAFELIFFAVFLSLAFNPAVTWLVHFFKLKSRIAATAIAYILVLSVVIFFSIVVVFPLIKQSVIYARDAPTTISRLKDDKSSTIGKFIHNNNLESQIDGLSANIQQRTQNLKQPAIQTAGRLGSVFISILTVFVLTFMMLVEGPDWIKRYWSLQPIKRRKHHQYLAHQMYDIITGYVNGQLLLALLAALLALIALSIASTLLHVSINAVALAGIVFVTGLIPMIGHIIGGTIVVLACLFVSLPLALIMAAYLIIHQQIENVTLQPYIQAKFNELTPLLVFIAALVGIAAGGLLGAFVAIPIAGCLRIVAQDYLETRKAAVK